MMTSITIKVTPAIETPIINGISLKVPLTHFPSSSTVSDGHSQL